MDFMCFLWQANEKSKKATNVLMTVLSGDTAVQAQTMTDKEVVDSCMNTLRKLFPYKVKHCLFLINFYRKAFSWFHQFSPSTKSIISKFQFNQDRGPTWKPAKADVASSLNVVIFFIPLFIYIFINLFILMQMLYLSCGKVNNIKNCNW